MYLDLGRWITGSAFVLELAYSSAAASVYISREHGKLTPDIDFV